MQLFSKFFVVLIFLSFNSCSSKKNEVPVIQSAEQVQGVTQQDSNSSPPQDPQTCADVQTGVTLFSSPEDCWNQTFSHCTGEIQNLSGQAATCYRPADNFQACVDNKPVWNTGAWTNWCGDNVNGVSVLKRTRSATCNNQGLAQCACGSAPELKEICSVHPTEGYKPCKQVPARIIACGGISVATPPVPVSNVPVSKPNVGKGPKEIPAGIGTIHGSGPVPVPSIPKTTSGAPIKIPNSN